MAGQLIQVATETVTSAVANVTLTGIDSDDVYMFTFNNIVQVGIVVFILDLQKMFQEHQLHNLL